MAHADFEEIVDNFSFLDDWEDRYRALIELGKAMPELEASLKTPAYKVEGCASQVWIVPHIRGHGKRAEFSFSGDSDALIVRGLIALLQKLVGGLRMDELAELDISKELRRLELDTHLSQQRSNGVQSMIARIKSWAEAAVKADIHSSSGA